jgi:hypothetical protein
MIPIRFNTLDSEEQALDRLAGRFHVKRWATREILVPEAALAYLATEGFDFQVAGSAAPQPELDIPLRVPESPPSSCLVRISPGPDGQVSAQLLGAPDLSATAATFEEALERLRAQLQEQVNLASLVAIEIPRRHPLMERAGYLKDDPDFEEYVGEIRKFREEMNRRDGYVPDTDECPDTSSTPTT